NALLGSDFKLGPLSDNGGPTWTHALLTGSPAINAGSNPAGLTTDERGPGFARQSGAAPDIGAFEVQAPPIVISVQINDGSAQRSRVTSLTVSFDVPVSLPPNPADAFQLQRQSDNAFVSLTAIQTGNVVTLNFNPGTAIDFGSLADGRYTLTVLAANVSATAGALDGNGDGTGGDDYVLASPTAPNPPSGIFRFFGDLDGDGDVDASNFLTFR